MSDVVDRRVVGEEPWRLEPLATVGRVPLASAVIGFISSDDRAVRTNPVELTGVEIVPDGPTWTARFEIHPTGTPTRRFLVSADADTVAVASASIELDTPSDLANPANGAGFILITHEDLVDTTPASAYDQFLAARAARG